MLKDPERDINKKGGNNRLSKLQTIFSGRKKYILSVATLIIAIIAWEIWAIVFKVPWYFIPKPSVIATSFFEKDNMLHLWVNTRITLVSIISGFSVAASFGLLLAVILSHSELLYKSLYPAIFSTRSVPTVVIAPLLIIWFGFGYLPVIAMVTIMCFFPILVNGIAGFKSASRSTIELMRSYDATTMQTLRYIRIPLALPYIFSGLKIAATSAVIGAAIGEWFSPPGGAIIGGNPIGCYGLGFCITQSSAYLNPTLLFRVLTALSTITMIFYGLILLAERLTLKWQRVTR